MTSRRLPRTYHLPLNVPVMAVAEALADEDIRRFPDGRVAEVRVDGRGCGWCWRHLTADNRVDISWVAKWP